MQQSLLDMLRGIGRVILLRGSPERVHYSRRRFIVALLLAVAAAAAAQAFYHLDHIVFVILRVFAEITVFMLAMVVLTAWIARFRLAYVMLLLVLISVSYDLALLLLAVAGQILGTLPWPWYAGAPLALSGVYGAANVMAWGLRKPLLQGLLVVLAMLATSAAIEQAFRWLYGLAAAG